MLQIPNSEPSRLPLISEAMTLYSTPEAAPAHGPMMAATMAVPMESRNNGSLSWLANLPADEVDGGTQRDKNSQVSSAQSAFGSFHFLQFRHGRLSSPRN